MTRGLAVAVLAVGLVGPAFGQTLTTNEPTKGKLNKDGEQNEWVVDVEDGDKIRFTVTCETARLTCRLTDDSKAGVAISPVNGKGVASGAWVHGENEIEVESDKKLPKGKYTIIVTGHFGKGKGPYDITLVSPKKKGDLAAPAPGGGAKPGDAAALQKELAALKDEVADLKNRLRLVEKLLAEKK